MKLKIAILTLVSYNHGNRLQNYALQTVLEEMGFEVETLLRNRLSSIQKIKRIIRNNFIADKYTKFNKFNRIIKWSKDIVSPEVTTISNDSKYDYYVVGSDQIWNPRIDDCTECVYLPEIEMEKKVAYSVSFGVNDFQDYEKKRILPLIKNFKGISVREEAGKKFINEVYPNKSILTLDPVLLLKRDDWKRMEKKPDCLLPEDYLLTYFLGNDRYEKVVKTVSETYGLNHFEIQPSLTPIDPFEFLYLIDHAHYIITDSFHGAVFSFIFGKNFKILERRDDKEDMSSRLDSFCKLFKLDKFRGYDLTDIEEYDFSENYMILKKERERSLKYLREMLSNE